jgi:GT2 family glycosyltransferase
MTIKTNTTAVIVTYNSAEYIGECIESLGAQSYGPIHVVVVDSNSSDGTADLIEAMYPHVEVVRCGSNVGYRDGNRIGMSLRPSDYMVVLNDDVTLAPNAIELLVNYLKSVPRAALVTPMVLVHHRPEVMNTAGNRLSYCGLASCRGKWEAPRLFGRSGPVAAVGGCTFVMRGTVLEGIGGLSEHFGQYRSGYHGTIEDADLSLRTWIAGHEVHYVADAVVFHRYSQRAMSVQRYAALDCGRILLMLRNLECGTLVRLLPMIATMEIGMFIFAALRGPKWFMAKLDVLRWIVTHPKEIREMRRTIQRVRTVPDSEFLWRLDDRIEFSGTLGGGRMAHMLEGTFSTVLRGYRHIFFNNSPFHQARESSVIAADG